MHFQIILEDDKNNFFLLPLGPGIVDLYMAICNSDLTNSLKKFIASRYSDTNSSNTKDYLVSFASIKESEAYITTSTFSNH